MTSTPSTLSLFPPKPVRVYRFLWVSKTGPKLRLFASPESFTGYVLEVRRLLGPASVEWRTPTLCVGVVQ